MGILDSIMQMVGKGKAPSTAAAGGSNTLMGAVAGLVGQGGGNLPALLEKLAAGGLGGAASSWVSKGPNQPVSGADVQSALGSDTVAGIASQLGLPHDQAASGIASVLPQIVDQLTPDGVVPDTRSLAKLAGGLLGK